MAIVRSDLELVFGTRNIEDYADLDNNGTNVDERITAAIAEAKAIFKNEVGREVDETDDLEKTCVVRLAAWTLYQARAGEQDTEDGGPGRMFEHKKLAMQHMAGLKEIADSRAAAPDVVVHNSWEA